ncbi:hypothetical protein Tco_0952764 [Tanacetum coccineum]|uniref:Uncharacterized protein n=1 Tax=Tanacetum coccineum TaxID=301880 RepID=A0ABQ5E3Q7_9ASTR
MSTYLKNMAGYKHIVKGSETRTEESSKRAWDKLEFDKSKKQKIDEHVEAKKDDDPEEEEIAYGDKGQKGFYHLIRADGSSKRYSSMIRMLQGIDREDLELSGSEGWWWWQQVKGGGGGCGGEGVKGEDDEVFGNEF